MLSYDMLCKLLLEEVVLYDVEYRYDLLIYVTLRYVLVCYAMCLLAMLSNVRLATTTQFDLNESELDFT